MILWQYLAAHFLSSSQKKIIFSSSGNSYGSCLQLLRGASSGCEHHYHSITGSTCSAVSFACSRNSCWRFCKRPTRAYIVNVTKMKRLGLTEIVVIDHKYYRNFTLNFSPSRVIWHKDVWMGRLFAQSVLCLDRAMLQTYTGVVQRYFNVRKPARVAYGEDCRLA